MQIGEQTLELLQAGLAAIQVAQTSLVSGDLADEEKLRRTVTWSRDLGVLIKMLTNTKMCAN